MANSVPINVELRNRPLDIENLAANFRESLRGQRDTGAIVSFTGIVRGSTGSAERIDKLVLEHYPGMTDGKLRSLATTTQHKWKLAGLDLRHRIGVMIPGDVIVSVLVATAHRQDAFTACAFIVDHLKTDVPIWKKEYGSFGERWVVPALGEDCPRGPA